MIKVDDTAVYGAIQWEQVAAMDPRLKVAWETLQKGTGAGNGFLGWVRLPEQYDRAEFARIQKAYRRQLSGCPSGSGTDSERKL